jgi:integrase/recombinase XerD
MTSLSDHLERYLALRRELGYRLERCGRLLSSFVSYIEESGESSVTVKVTEAWIREVGAKGAARRLSLVRGFATYMSGFDPSTEIPPSWLAPAEVRRQRPFIYSKEEIHGLIEAARRLQPRLWGSTMATLIGLLAAAGLRPGEAYRLDRLDVDLRAGELRVLNSKYGKSRVLPLHPSTVKALGRYARLRDELASESETAFFFGRAGRRRIASAQAAPAFRDLLATTSISTGPGRRPPRLYDFRHSFAVNTLVDWHRSGVDVGRQLPVLSAYLGHLVPGNTYWYLEATPELLGVVSGRMSEFFEAER